MSLIDMLLNEPSTAERAMGVISSMPPAGGHDPRSSADLASAPSGMLSPGEGGSTALARRIAEWIQSRKGAQFSVGGLEGYKGTGQISSGHIDNSQHYTGHAGDVSWIGGPRFDNEMQALDWLNAKLQKRWGDALTELIWRAPDHYDHLHFGTRPGG